MIVRKILESRSRNPVKISPADTATTIARLLGGNRRGFAVVCDADDKLLGVLSVMDIVRALGEHEAGVAALSARSLMNTEFVVCRPQDSVEDALNLMAAHEIRHLPVVEEDRLIGVVNIRDVLEYRFEAAERTSDELTKYIFSVGYR
jgi:CBS domain-containing protein